jgi:hypothetical protein
VGRVPPEWRMRRADRHDDLVDVGLRPGDAPAVPDCGRLRRSASASPAVRGRAEVAALPRSVSGGGGDRSSGCGPASPGGICHPRPVRGRRCGSDTTGSTDGPWNGLHSRLWPGPKRRPILRAATGNCFEPSHQDRYPAALGTDRLSQPPWLPRRQTTGLRPRHLPGPSTRPPGV